MASRTAFHAALLAAVALAAFTSGCDPSFSAFAETEKAFSVFGYLDATADTQWVRVEPLQDSILVGTEPFEARVTTTNLSTGETVVWEKRRIDLGAGVTVQSYYTTVDIAPETTYRFTVGGAAGTSTAEVTVPPDFPSPVITDPSDLTTEKAEITTIIVRGVEHLGAVLATYDYEFCIPVSGGGTLCYPETSTVSHLQDAVRRADGTFRIDITATEDIPEGEKAILAEFYSFHVTVASVSEDWPDYEVSIDSLRRAPQPPAGVGTNIENGTGFLGGAVTKTVEVPIIRGEERTTRAPR